MSGTRTYAIVAVSPAAYTEIDAKIRSAGYEHALEGGVIDMHWLALQRETTPTDSLPPDAATGLYLDRRLDRDDLEWTKMAWDALLSTSRATRPAQIMLVFQAIRRDERTLAAFLQAMNELVLPLCRRVRLSTMACGCAVGAHPDTGEWSYASLTDGELCSRGWPR